jgi:hypothetical protein
VIEETSSKTSYLEQLDEQVLWSCYGTLIGASEVLPLKDLSEEIKDLILRFKFKALDLKVNRLNGLCPVIDSAS